MLKRGDKVIIIGSSCVRDFTEAIVVGTDTEGLPTLVQFKKMVVLILLKTIIYLKKII